MQEHGIERKIGLLHWDVEVQYAKTTEYVERTFTSAPDYVDKFWGCLPFAIRNTMSQSDPWWYPWDPEKKDIWTRKMPEYPFVINIDNNLFDFYKYKMPLERNVYTAFNKWYRRYCGGGKTISLIGIRTSESLHRYNAIVNKKHCYENKKYITCNAEDICTGAPLYDWETEDIWTAIGKFDLDYNALYDLYYQAGIPMSKMRVASPYIEWAVSSLKLYKELDPDSWKKAVGRIEGVNFGSIYGDTKAMGYKDIDLPPGHTWKSYAEFLLSTIPENTRRIYLKKFGNRTDWKQLCTCILKDDIRGRTFNDANVGPDKSANKARIEAMIHGKKA